MASADSPGSDDRRSQAQREGSTRAIATDGRHPQKRRSLAVVHELIARFDRRKRQLVEGIGFGGLLKFPRIKYTNRRFASWLMSRVDVPARCIVIGDGSRITFSKEDVGIVFGIPVGGRNVIEAGQVSKQSREKISQWCWPKQGKDQRSIKSLEEALHLNFTDQMNVEQEAAFKVAFVIYVMSVLLAPAVKYDYVSIDYWAALADPDAIDKFDWADYVFQRLLAAVGKYKSELNSAAWSPHLSGCHFFLQVLYLDSVDLGEFSLDHSMQPRVGSFSAEAIRAMTALDCVNPGGNEACTQFGVSKLRQPTGICYSWGCRKQNESCERSNAVKPPLWEIAVRVARVLRLPLESAGPLFTGIVEIQREFQHIFGNIGLISIDALLHIMRPYVNGLIQITDSQGICFAQGMQAGGYVLDESSRYLTIDFDQHCGDKRKTCRGILRCSSCGSPDSSAETCPVSVWVRQDGIVHSNVERIVHLAIAKFHLAVAQMKAHNRIDLNSAGYDSSTAPSLIGGHTTALPVGTKSPWELGGMWHLQSLGAVEVSAFAEGCYDDAVVTRPLVLHHVPKFIEVTPTAARGQLNGRAEMEMDLFDALVRRFMQRDDVIYACEDRRRWRHFFESDILASVIAGCFDIHNSNIRNQFLGCHIRYDVSSCSKLFFPVLLQHRWVCFCWCTAENKIVIFDPIRRIIPGFYSGQVYGNVVAVLKSMMCTTVPELFAMWEFDWSNPAVEVFQWPHGGNDWLNRTGIACAYFCICYDGRMLVPDISKSELGRLPEMLMAEISMLEGNRGLVTWRPDRDSIRPSTRGPQPHGLHISRPFSATA